MPVWTQEEAFQSPLPPNIFQRGGAKGNINNNNTNNTTNSANANTTSVSSGSNRKRQWASTAYTDAIFGTDRVLVIEHVHSPNRADPPVEQLLSWSRVAVPAVMNFLFFRKCRTAVIYLGKRKRTSNNNNNSNNNNGNNAPKSPDADQKEGIEGANNLKIKLIRFLTTDLWPVIKVDLPDESLPLDGAGVGVRGEGGHAPTMGGERLFANSDIEAFITVKNAANGRKYVKMVLRCVRNKIFFDVMMPGRETQRWEERRLHIRMLDNLESKKAIESYSDYVSLFREACAFSKLYAAVLESTRGEKIEVRYHHQQLGFFYSSHRGYIVDPNTAQTLAANAVETNAAAEVCNIGAGNGGGGKVSPSNPSLFIGANASPTSNTSANPHGHQYYGGGGEQQQGGGGGAALVLAGAGNKPLEEGTRTLALVSTSACNVAAMGVGGGGQSPALTPSLMPLFGGAPLVSSSANGGGGGRRTRANTLTNNNGANNNNTNNCNNNNVVTRGGCGSKISTHSTLGRTCYQLFEVLTRPESTSLDYKSYYANPVAEILDKSVPFMCGFLNSGYRRGKLVIGVHEVARRELSPKLLLELANANTTTSNAANAVSNASMSNNNADGATNSRTPQLRPGSNPPSTPSGSNKKSVGFSAESNTNANGSFTAAAAAPSSSAAAAASDIFVHNEQVEQVVVGLRIDAEGIKMLEDEISDRLEKCIPPIPPQFVKLDFLPVVWPAEKVAEAHVLVFYAMRPDLGGGGAAAALAGAMGEDGGDGLGGGDGEGEVEELGYHIKREKKDRQRDGPVHHSRKPKAAASNKDAPTKYTQQGGKQQQQQHGRLASTSVTDDGGAEVGNDAATPTPSFGRSPSMTNGTASVVSPTWSSNAAAAVTGHGGEGGELGAAAVGGGRNPLSASPSASPNATHGSGGGSGTMDVISSSEGLDTFSASLMSSSTNNMATSASAAPSPLPPQQQQQQHNALNSGTLNGTEATTAGRRRDHLDHGTHPPQLIGLTEASPMSPTHEGREEDPYHDAPAPPPHMVTAATAVGEFPMIDSNNNMIPMVLTVSGPTPNDAGAADNTCTPHNANATDAANVLAPSQLSPPMDRSVYRQSGAAEILSPPAMGYREGTCPPMRSCASDAEDGMGYINGSGDTVDDGIASDEEELIRQRDRDVIVSSLQNNNNKYKLSAAWEDAFRQRTNLSVRCLMSHDKVLCPIDLVDYPQLQDAILEAQYRNAREGMVSSFTLDEMAADGLAADGEGADADADDDGGDGPAADTTKDDGGDAEECGGDDDDNDAQPFADEPASTTTAAPSAGRKRRARRYSKADGGDADGTGSGRGGRRGRPQRELPPGLRLIDRPLPPTRVEDRWDANGIPIVPPSMGAARYMQCYLVVPRIPTEQPPPTPKQHHWGDGGDDVIPNFSLPSATVCGNSAMRNGGRGGGSSQSRSVSPAAAYSANGDGANSDGGASPSTSPALNAADEDGNNNSGSHRKESKEERRDRKKSSAAKHDTVWDSDLLLRLKKVSSNANRRTAGIFHSLIKFPVPLAYPSLHVVEMSVDARRAALPKQQPLGGAGGAGGNGTNDSAITLITDEDGNILSQQDGGNNHPSITIYNMTSVTNNDNGTDGGSGGIPPPPIGELTTNLYTADGGSTVPVTFTSTYTAGGASATATNTAAVASSNKGAGGLTAWGGLKYQSGAHNYMAVPRVPHVLDDYKGQFFSGWPTIPMWSLKPQRQGPMGNNAMLWGLGGGADDGFYGGGTQEGASAMHEYHQHTFGGFDEHGDVVPAASLDPSSRNNGLAVNGAGASGNNSPMSGSGGGGGLLSFVPTDRSIDDFIVALPRSYAAIVNAGLGKGEVSAMKDTKRSAAKFHDKVILRICEFLQGEPPTLGYKGEERALVMRTLPSREVRAIRATCKRYDYIISLQYGLDRVTPLKDNAGGEQLIAAGTSRCSHQALQALQQCFTIARISKIPLILAWVFEHIGALPSPFPFIGATAMDMGTRPHPQLIPLYYVPKTVPDRGEEMLCGGPSCAARLAVIVLDTNDGQIKRLGAFSRKVLKNGAKVSITMGVSPIVGVSLRPSKYSTSVVAAHVAAFLKQQALMMASSAVGLVGHGMGSTSGSNGSSTYHAGASTGTTGGGAGGGGSSTMVTPSSANMLPRHQHQHGRHQQRGGGALSARGHSHNHHHMMFPSRPTSGGAHHQHHNHQQHHTQHTLSPAAAPSAGSDGGAMEGGGAPMGEWDRLDSGDMQRAVSDASTGYARTLLNPPPTAAGTGTSDSTTPSTLTLTGGEGGGMMGQPQASGASTAGTVLSSTGSGGGGGGGSNAPSHRMMTPYGSYASPIHGQANAAANPKGAAAAAAAGSVHAHNMPPVVPSSHRGSPSSLPSHQLPLFSGGAGGSSLGALPAPRQGGHAGIGMGGRRGLGRVLSTLDLAACTNVSKRSRDMLLSAPTPSSMGGLQYDDDAGRDDEGEEGDGKDYGKEAGPLPVPAVPAEQSQQPNLSPSSPTDRLIGIADVSVKKDDAQPQPHHLTTATTIGVTSSTTFLDPQLLLIGSGENNGAPQGNGNGAPSVLSAADLVTPTAPSTDTTRLGFPTNSNTNSNNVLISGHFRIDPTADGAIGVAGGMMTPCSGSPQPNLQQLLAKPQYRRILKEAGDIMGGSIRAAAEREEGQGEGGSGASSSGGIHQHVSLTSAAATPAENVPRAAAMTKRGGGGTASADQSSTEAVRTLVTASYNIAQFNSSAIANSLASSLGLHSGGSLHGILPTTTELTLPLMEFAFVDRANHVITGGGAQGGGVKQRTPSAEGRAAEETAATTSYPYRPSTRASPSSPTNNRLTPHSFGPHHVSQRPPLPSPRAAGAGGSAVPASGPQQQQQSASTNYAVSPFGTLAPWTVFNLLSWLQECSERSERIRLFGHNKLWFGVFLDPFSEVCPVHRNQLIPLVTSLTQQANAAVSTPPPSHPSSGGGGGHHQQHPSQHPPMYSPNPNVFGSSLGAAPSSSSLVPPIDVDAVTNVVRRCMVPCGNPSCLIDTLLLQWNTD